MIVSAKDRTHSVRKQGVFFCLKYAETRTLTATIINKCSKFDFTYTIIYNIDNRRTT